MIEDNFRRPFSPRKFACAIKNLEEIGEIEGLLAEVLPNASQQSSFLPSLGSLIHFL